MNSFNKPWILIGHRGVGKSTLATSLQPCYEVTDLDREIERQTKSSIDELIAKDIQNFRKVEGKVLLELLQHQSTALKSQALPVIVAGAGIEPKYLDQAQTKANILWIRRDSDREGRIFLNRPRLITRISALEESKLLYDRRQPQYQAHAHEFLDLPEGPFHSSQYQNFIQNVFNGGLQTPQWIETLEQGAHWQRDLERILFLQQSKFVELRNDLLPESLICEILKTYPHERILVSLRKKISSVLRSGLVSFTGAVDCDLTLEKNLALTKQACLRIVSVHGEYKQHLKFVQNYRGPHHLKWAPTIDSLSQLMEAHSLSEGLKISFLPLSADGRWKFYRLLRSKKNLLNFTRSRAGIYRDQPTLWDIHAFVESKPKSKWFAVLGQNTVYSWSPFFHQSFATDRGENFFSLSLPIEPSESELSFLRGLGMHALAVTSPYKAWAAKISHSDESHLNTLVWQSGKWLGTNTDSLALQKTTYTVPVVIWGAGAMGQLLQSLLPHASQVSAREAKPDLDHCPHTLIWAAKPQGLLPPLAWRPQVVVDLNYFESSLARDYAIHCGSRYVSGEEFFVTQALAQQKFWSHTEES